MVVADSPLGIRVVSVEDASQAAWGDLRAEDIIVSVDGKELRSIDEFSMVSNALKGRAAHAGVVIFRNGTPRELTLHLYSYPILRAWGVECIPEHDVRFAEPRVGLAYWSRLGRGFEEADKPTDALNAYLNGLHNVPDDAATAFTVSRLSLRVSRERLESRQLLEGVTLLHQALLILEQLFNYSLSDEQLSAIKRELEEVLTTLQSRRTSSRIDVWRSS